ncbi:MAG: TraR/DksA C4-type zinc finger protein [candidate division WOR-3 bacterium]|nr:MAG: TraR/DksA C4-type zinc finger protein [candidate division WOR-3 bacterium]
MKMKRTGKRRMTKGKKRSARSKPAKRTAAKRTAKRASKRKAAATKSRKPGANRVVRKKPAAKRPAKKKTAARSPGRRAKGMSRADILRFEKELLKEKHRILKQGDFADELMDNSSESSGNGSRGEYDAEMGSQNYRRELASRLKSLESDALREIDAALRRINQGTYGSCESCGRPIAKARLEVVPHARICMRCLRGARTG